MAAKSSIAARLAIGRSFEDCKTNQAPPRLMENIYAQFNLSSTAENPTSCSGNPEYVQAIFYKALLCREKQKAAEDETERARWADESQKLAAKAMDIQRRKEGR